MRPEEDPSKMGEPAVARGPLEAAMGETTPLLGSRDSNACCDTFPETSVEDAWKPPRGFWWIEVGTSSTGAACRVEVTPS